MAMIVMYCILLAFIHISGSHAREHIVRDETGGWAVPNKIDDYDLWAGQQRFQVGDSLAFVYNPNEDSVLQVTQTNYLNCNTSQPLSTLVFKDGKASFVFNHSGPFFFISNASGHCQKHEKLLVVVISNHVGASQASPPLPPHVPPAPPAPAPAPAPPAPAPAPAAPSPEAAPPTSTGVPAVLPLKSTGFMCALLLSVSVFTL